VIANEAKQSSFVERKQKQGCFLAAAVNGRAFARPLAPCNDVQPTSPVVIPGRAKREPGIHTPDCGYGFRACASKSAVAGLDIDIAELG
jgi:hypothetical protein